MTSDVNNVRSTLIGVIHQPRSCDRFTAHGLFVLGGRYFEPFPFDHTPNEYLIVAIEYFTKWIEVEPVAEITSYKVHILYGRTLCASLEF